MSTPQLGLFDSPAQRSRAAVPRARNRMQETSLSARDSVLSDTARMRRRVLDYIRACGEVGATDHEISAALLMQLSTVNPRRGELVAGKLVVKSDKRRATLAGRSAIVWVART